MLLLALIAGWRPSNRSAGYLLAAPFVSVSTLAWTSGNPFNGATFAVLSLALIGLTSRLSKERVNVASSFLLVPGALLVVFGWTYPHFLAADHWTTYLYAAPFGLLPCPTLSAVIGLTLMLGMLRSRAWSVTLAAAGLIYGAMGVFGLGVTLDYGLLGGAVLLMAIALGSRDRRKITSVREIATGVYCLGPRGRTQTDIYFVRSGSSWVLIDTGWPKDACFIQQAAESVFGADARPASILLTHFHPDHAGSALELARIWNCPVYLHPDELPLANGSFAAMAEYAGPLDRWFVLPLMRALGSRRRGAMLARSSLKDVSRAFEPGGHVPDLAGWQQIPTPGHTPGHVSFFRASDRVLITGDAVVTLKLNSLAGLLFQRQGLSGPPWYTSWNWQAAKESVAKLARLDPNVLACGHGVPMIGAGTASALRAFANRSCGPTTTLTTTLLDELLPIYDISDEVATVVHADGATTWNALMQVDLIEVGRRRPLVGILGAIRTLPDIVSRVLHGELPQSPPEHLRLHDTTLFGLGKGGWVLLGERPGEEIALGLVGKFWRPVIEFAKVSAEQFPEFSEPGYAKTIYSLSLRPLDAHHTLLSGVMRTATTDAHARRWFRRYWTLGVGSGAHVLVNGLLDVTREMAEARIA
jgi:glyoxylase-like metal-dependent hydrolase (beta-lactamase superfamily II)